MNEKNYDFRARHWQYHKLNRLDVNRKASSKEVLITKEWKIGFKPSKDNPITSIAAKDFRDYLETSMNLSLAIEEKNGPKTIWLEIDKSIDKGFVLSVTKEVITLKAAEDRMIFQGTIHLEDLMNLESAPVLTLGSFVRKPLYNVKQVHSGTGIDAYPDSELLALLHAGFDSIEVFMVDFDRNNLGYCDINDIITRAARFGIKTFLFNYIRTFVHPDDENAQETFDKVYGEVFRRYPLAAGISLCGESLEFPSKDPNTTGKPYNESVVDGIPDTRPSPGWYPCLDYPAYIQGIERAVHKVSPNAKVSFSTYNWGYAPFELRKKFLANFPKNVVLSVCYEIFSHRKLEKYSTCVMDYTISAEDPGYYFVSECEEAHRLGIEINGNVNTTGIAWDFGCVPLVPAPKKILKRNLNLRKAAKDWNVVRHYSTHHYGWYNSVAADLGKWSSWEDFEPDYNQLLTKIAIRDYGKDAAPYIKLAWNYWSKAMDYYIASNEDQYGPWRVGAAYPFIFQPIISRTMQGKEISFPTASWAHWGGLIVKTLYTPYENTEQTPGFLRYPAEIRSLKKMLKLWNKGLDAVNKAILLSEENKVDETKRLEALGHFIRNSIITTIHIKEWWQANIALQNSKNSTIAEKYLDKLVSIALSEIDNAKDTISSVEFDSRLGWEPSMEYVCDKWHLEWKIRQVNSALGEIATYRKILKLHLAK
jgi:hypothetical protein